MNMDEYIDRQFPNLKDEFEELHPQLTVESEEFVDFCYKKYQDLERINKEE